MAKIVQQKITIVLSKVAKNEAPDEVQSFISADHREALGQVVEELLSDPNIVVEIE